MNRLGAVTAASMMAAQILAVCGAASEPTENRRYDCGIQSLYTLLRLEGVNVTLDRLERSLPAPSPTGYSLAELRDAASTCGLKLIGARLKPDAQAIDRPILAFLQRGKHGHFIVLRPAGHTGTLAQVLDMGSDPEMIDKATIFKSPEWTGLALLPARPNWPARIAGASGLGGISIVLSPWIVKRLRRLRSRPS
jgi:hypothetical protein